MNTSKNYIGTCTMCGKENCNLTIIDDVDHVCEECLDSHYQYCDECGEYWDYMVIEFTYLKDGRAICEYCAEDLDIDEDDIEYGDEE